MRLCPQPASPTAPVLSAQGCENGPKGKEEGGLGRKEPLSAPLVNHRVLKEGLRRAPLVQPQPPGLLLIPCHQHRLRGSLGERQVPIRWNPWQAMGAKGGLRTRCLEEFLPPCPQSPWKERLSRAPPRPRRPGACQTDQCPGFLLAVVLTESSALSRGARSAGQDEIM